MRPSRSVGFVLDESVVRRKARHSSRRATQSPSRFPNGRARAIQSLALWRSVRGAIFADTRRRMSFGNREGLCARTREFALALRRAPHREDEPDRETTSSCRPPRIGSRGPARPFRREGPRRRDLQERPVPRERLWIIGSCVAPSRPPSAVASTRDARRACVACRDLDPPRRAASPRFFPDAP
jgi:hypothetical protein